MEKYLTKIKSYSYFDIYELPKKNKRKTNDYAIISSRGEELGFIMFYNKWRQHVLISKENNVWSSDCLMDLCNFINWTKNRLRQKNGKS